MSNIQDNITSDGFIGLAYVSEDQGDKESRIQTFDSISWASRAVIDGFTDKTITKVSELSDGDFSTGINPVAADDSGSGWMLDNTPTTAEIVNSWEEKPKVLHLKNTSSSWEGIKAIPVGNLDGVNYIIEALVWVKESGTGTLADNITFYWNTGSGSDSLVETELVAGQWIKLTRAAVTTSAASKNHLYISVKNGCEVYVDYFTVTLENSLILKDLRGVGNGISPNGSGVSTTYTYKSKSFQTHPIGADAGDGSGTYINKAVVVADFVKEGLSDIVIKTNFHDQSDGTNDYTWYDSANSIDRLGQEVTTSGVSSPWLSASGQYMQVEINVITDAAGNGATIDSYGCFTDPALYPDD